jgi:predicted DNA-binding protein YlxM (UPF0122 family)
VELHTEHRRSLRAIADLAGISHQAVANIIERSNVSGKRGVVQPQERKRAP